MIDFLERNKEDLYVREASMFVYGDSKWFEDNNYEEVCTFLRAATDCHDIPTIDPNAFYILNIAGCDRYPSFGEAPYSEVLKYMKEHNVKLEQEIVSSTIDPNAFYILNIAGCDRYPSLEL